MPTTTPESPPSPPPPDHPAPSPSAPFAPHLDTAAMTSAAPRREEPNLLLLLLLFLSLLVTGGLAAWMRATPAPVAVEAAPPRVQDVPALVPPPQRVSTHEEEGVPVEVRPRLAVPVPMDSSRGLKWPSDALPGEKLPSSRLDAPTDLTLFPFPKTPAPPKGSPVRPHSPENHGVTPVRPHAPSDLTVSPFPKTPAPSEASPVPLHTPSDRQVLPSPAAPGPASHAPAGHESGAPEVLYLRAQFTLEGPGYLSSIHVNVFQDGRCATIARMNLGGDGRVCLEVPERTSYLLVATAPGHAWAARRLDLREGEADGGAPVELPLTREYLIDVVDFDLAPRAVETRRVRAGDFLQDLEFSQEGAGLHATNTKGSCVLRALGNRPLGQMTVPTRGGADAECDFGLAPGAVFAVRQGTRWFAVRLREPGYLPAALEGPRRVIKPSPRPSPPRGEGESDAS